MGELYLVLAAGAMAAGFVQGLSGFGFGMVAMSFWAWTVEPRLAAPMAVFGALSGQLLAAFTVRRGFALARLLPFVAGGLLGIPLGLKVLPYLDPVVFKVCIGGLLAVWCPLMLCAGRLPRISVGGRTADGVAGLMGGVMGGLGGFTGVIPTLWCTLRGYDRDTQRAVIQNFNLSMLTVTMIGYVVTGVVTSAMLPQFAVVLPAMLVPAWLGTRVYTGISDAAFRRVVLGLLTLSGIALLAASLPRLLA
ncbi:permease [Achromobacter sp. DMS1]|uniref:sulfite exporter TauE/SafE family protein n=1 Tax=Achromobacter sp. DMS1 TaxID=1688405 RepID=UPI00069E3868|nr:sulfite exporter TauE/SafE family protein [Achromobacter sp. DMS1]KOF53994.1 permease [Achromobacter sp. DMS1]KOF54013.1 permease [Achromobacter sp. DMS1]